MKSSSPLKGSHLHRGEGESESSISI